MLLNYKFKNFCSFKDKADFSLRATESNRCDFPENYFHGTNDVLKSAVIVGENAGGKSNFIKSLQYLKKFFKDNQPVKSSSDYLNDDFTKVSEIMCYGDTLQTFSLEILLNNVIYSYELHIDYLGIKYEKLSVQKNFADEFIPIFIVKRTEQYDLIKKLWQKKFPTLILEVVFTEKKW